MKMAEYETECGKRFEAFVPMVPYIPARRYMEVIIGHDDNVPEECRECKWTKLVYCIGKLCKGK